MTRHAGDIDCSYNAQHATEQVLCRLKTAAIDSSYTPFVLLHLLWFLSPIHLFN